MKIFYWFSFFVNRAKFEWARGAKDGFSPARSSKESEIVAILRSGTYIGAIKRYRELDKCGLKDAKDAVDAIIVRYDIPTPWRS